MPPTVQRTPPRAAFAHACWLAADLSRDELLGAAIARGCLHYAPFIARRLVRDQVRIPHEVLACALLRGAADVDTFQAIRVGTMVLSDLGNSPDAVAHAAEAFEVTSRVSHIARTALTADSHRDYWQALLDALGR